jgi:succinyl-diaminopimelate desuccinylase
VVSVTRIAGGIADNVVPDRVECHVNYRFAPGRTPEGAEARLRELCPGDVRVESLAPSAPVATANPRARALVAAGGLRVAPKQAWTPVAEFAQAGLDAVNFGPGTPSEAHTREESVEIAALVRAYRVLEAFAA